MIILYFFSLLQYFLSFKLLNYIFFIIKKEKKFSRKFKKRFFKLYYFLNLFEFYFVLYIF